MLFSRTTYYLFLAAILSGCMSMPKPDSKQMDEVPAYMKQYKEKLQQGDADGATTSLNQALDRITAQGKLKGGKGSEFRDEAEAVSLLGHIQFNKGNVNEAANKWFESFQIEYNGYQAEHLVEQKNANIRDLVATVASGIASGVAASYGQPKGTPVIYEYTTYSTNVPKPEIVVTGLAEGSVARIPVRVDSYPFDKVVRLTNKKNKTSCTATMVSRRVAISAAHCVSPDGRPFENANVSMSRQSIYQSTPLDVDKYFTHQGMGKGWDGKRANDWVVIVTDVPYDKEDNFPVVISSSYSNLFSNKTKLMLAGYSSDLRKGRYLTLHYGCYFKPHQKLGTGTYLSNCENAKGSSGGAIMTATPPYKIVAIHTAQLTDPKDEFYSVETFSPELVEVLQSVFKKYPDEVLNPKTSPQSIQSTKSPSQTLPKAQVTPSPPVVRPLVQPLKMPDGTQLPSKLDLVPKLEPK